MITRNTRRIRLRLNRSFRLQQLLELADLGQFSLRVERPCQVERRCQCVRVLLTEQQNPGIEHLLIYRVPPVGARKSPRSPRASGVRDWYGAFRKAGGGVLFKSKFGSGNFWMPHG